MKKIIIVCLLILVIFGGIMYFKNRPEEVDVNTSGDLFGANYSRAEKIISKMSLQQKVGQLFLVRYDKSIGKDYIDRYNVGGYILFAKDFDNHTKEEITKELKALQNYSNIPLILAVDEEGGYVTRVSRYPAFRKEKFKSPRSYYEEGGDELLKSTEVEKAKLLLSIGINLNLAPVADVSTDEEDFMNIRTFNRNAEETGELIYKMVGYANDNGISSCLKHFPGYGNNKDTHTGSAIDTRSYENFENNDYIPFKKGIEAKVPTILVSHNIVQAIDPDRPASISKKVNDELREKLGFSGIIITDDLAMGAISEYGNLGEAAVMAVQAGDNLLITSDIKVVYNAIIDAVRSREIDEKDINELVKKVIAWKITYNMGGKYDN